MNTEHIHRHLQGVQNLLSAYDAFCVDGDEINAHGTYYQLTVDCELLAVVVRQSGVQAMRDEHVQSLNDLLVDFRSFDKSGNVSRSLKSVAKAEYLIEVAKHE